MPSSIPNIDVHAMMRGLVHELRNPLSAILTASSLLESGQSVDEETTMLLDVIKKESQRMNRILTEFSLFVKPPLSHPENFDIAKVLRGLLHEMQTTGALDSSIQLRDELPANLLVFADPVQSYQAFQHLLNNAAQSMEKGGVLTLHTKASQQNESNLSNERESVVIFLEDEGAGLSETALERAFQPFFSTKPAATGLGLSIACELLGASGGGVLVENRDFNRENCDSGQPATLGARVRVHLRPATESSDYSSS